MLQRWIYIDAWISNNFIFIFFIMGKNYWTVNYWAETLSQRHTCFEQSGIAPICVMDSIRAVWRLSQSTAKVVSKQHLFTKCEFGLKYIFQNCVNKNVKKYINEYIIFCKNQNFKSKNNNKTNITMNSATKCQSNWKFSQRNIISI